MSVNPRRSDFDECYNLTLAEFQTDLDNLGVGEYCAQMKPVLHLPHCAMVGTQPDFVDLMLLHGPSEPFGNQDGCSALACELNSAQWKAYTTMLHAGKAKAIGGRLVTACRIDFAPL